MGLRALPNLITFARLLCSPLIAWLILTSHFRWALGVIAFAGLTDWFDGFAARTLRTSGQIGVLFDPLADKVLLVTLFFVLAFVRLIPIWMLALAVGRDLVIVVGALLVRLLRGVTKLPPNTMGKVSTFFQIVLVLLAVSYAAYPYTLLQWLEWTALALSAFFTAVSGWVYIRIGIAYARRRLPSPR